ncbi:MAG: pyridoxal-dependent decarboxylase [bacterium]|nr:pyridoxal-dependent decarboxylase [bacterium]
MSLRRYLDAATDRVDRFRTKIRKTAITPTVSAGVVREGLAERYGDFSRPWPAEQLVEDVSSMMASWNVHVTHPRYFGLFNPNVFPASVAADVLVAGFNPQLAAWSHAPAANEIERYTLLYLAGRLGFDPDRIAATFTTGGAEANQSALLAALNHAYPEYSELGLAESGLAEFGLTRPPGPPVVYVSSESHHSIKKAAMTSGLGSRAVRTVPTDDSFRLSVPALREAIAHDRCEGRRPLLVVGTAGSTGGGIIDPLAELATVCAQEKLWFHVDAAWGGAACLSPRLQPELAGIERADSVTWDAHKWLSVPMGAGMFFCTHPESVRRAFAVATPYMPVDIEDTADPYTWTIQWTRRHIGLKLFMSLAALGSEGYRDAIEHQAAMGELLRRDLDGRGWRIVNRTPLPVVCFTRPEIEDGSTSAESIAGRLAKDFWISPVRLGANDPVLRACITSYETSAGDVRALAEAVTIAAAQASQPNQHPSD